MRLFPYYLLAGLLVLTGCDSGSSEPDPLVAATLSIRVPNTLLPVGGGSPIDVDARTAEGERIEEPAVMWSTSAPTIAGVNADIVRVTGLLPGEAIITAQIGDLVARDTVYIYDLTGTWEATQVVSSPLLLTGPAPQTITFTLVQDRTNVTGTMTNSIFLGPGDAGNGTVTGTLNNRTFSHSFDMGAGCIWSMNGTLTVQRDPATGAISLNGNEWNATADCGAGAPFTWPMSVPMQRAAN